LEAQYGTALALEEMGDYKSAEDKLRTLLAKNEAIVPLHTALALNQAGQGNYNGAYKTFENAMALFPRNVPLTVRYCETLLRNGQADKAHKILLDLLNNVPPTLEQVRLIAMAANEAGEASEAHYYMAEYHAMQGNLMLAIEQLARALQSPGLDNVNRARYKARMQQFQQYLPQGGKRKGR
jgi:predicted Zn-dependent protease